MKKIVIALGAVLVLVIAALIALPAMVPADKIKSELVAQVKNATGRDLSIDGKVSVSAFPSLSVEVANVALSNPAGFSTKDMVRLGALDVKLKLLPILSGSVEVDSFVLVDPVLTIETDRKGKSNLDFGGTAADKPKETKEAKGAGSAGLGELKLGDVALKNGRVTIIDGIAGTKEDFTDINLAISLKSLDTPLVAKGGLKWRGQSVDLAVDAANPRAILDGKSSAASIAISSSPVKLSFKGDALMTGAKGDIDLVVPSVRELVKWTTGKPLDMAGTGMGPFSVKGGLNANGAKVALTNATIAIDAIKAIGDLAVDAGGARPALKGKLAVETLDLNPYLPPEDSKPAAKSAGKSDWSDAPMDSSGLKAADVDFALSVGAIKIKQIEIGKSALHLLLNNGRLTADLTELALYKGAGKGRFVVDGSQPGLGLDAGFQLKGLAAEPFLKAAAGFDRIEGTGNADINVAGRGRTERQLIQSLSGKGGITFLDGAIKGINLAAMVRNVTTAFTDTSGPQKTDFAELSGTYAIASGIVTNKDLALKSPLLRIEGAGTVDLPKRAMNYRVEPKAVASTEGQGGKGDVGGIMVPVVIEGPWDNLSYRPDLGAMVKGQAESAIKGALGGALPGAKPAAGESKPAMPLPINPGGLFGR